MKADTRKKWQSVSDTLGVKGSFDIGFFAIVMILLSVGIVMLFSASYVNAESRYGDPYHFFVSQSKFAVFGIIVMFIFSRLNVKVINTLTYVIAAVSLILLILVLIFPYYPPGKEEFKRWLGTSAFSFQPSEIAKLAIIIFCARILSLKNKPQIKGHDMSLIICFAAGMLVCLLVAFEKHLSCIILILGMVAVMMILGGLNKKLITLGIIGVIVGIILMLVFKEQLIEALPVNRYTERVIYWLDKDSAPLDERWQTNQSLYAIGSGGLFGLGLGNSKQKHLYMPEPQNDFIFAIICEELGFIGAVIIILLFALLIWRGFVIALRSSNKFSAFLVMGIISHVGLQTILNILVVTDAVPNTGISLPFFSSGGTALVMLLAEMGIVLSVSRSNNKK